MKNTKTNHVYIFDDLLGNASMYGIGTYMRELKKVFSFTGSCKFTIVTLNTRNKYKNEINDNNIRLIEFPLLLEWSIQNNEKYCRSVAFRLALSINESENNIFHFNYMHHLPLATHLKALFPAAKILLVIHFLKSKAYDIERCFTLLNGMYKNISESVEQEKHFLNLADDIVVLCSDTKKYIEQQYNINSSKIRTVFNFLKDRNLPSLRDNRNSLRYKYGFKDTDKLLLYIGRIEESKGIMDFKKVLKELSVDENLKLVVVGGGEYGRLLSLYPEINTHLILMGEVHNVSIIDELYCIADIGILPSYIEQCSYTAIEMMMHGIPIVGLYSFGLKEMFNLIPISSLHIESSIPYSHIAMSDLIRDLLDNPTHLRTEGHSNRKKYEKYYSPLNRNIWEELYTIC